MKTCTRCKVSQPLSSFTKKTSRPDGLDCWCKECNKKYRKKYYESNKEKLNEISRIYQDKNREAIRAKRRQRYIHNQEEEKEKNLQYYHEHSEERREYTKEYWKKHKDRLIKRNKVWKSKNSEIIAETRKKYVTKNRDRIRQVSSQYRKQHPEKIREIKRKWRATDFGKLSALNSRNKRRYLKKKTEDGSIPLKIRYPLTEELQQILDDQKNICYMAECDTEISRELKNIHLEHKIPLSKGGTHTIDNIAWSCADCNLEKGVRVIDDCDSNALS